MTGSRSVVLSALAAAVLLGAGPGEGASLPPAVRGARTILLRVKPGPLKITLYKRDLNIYDGADELIALLYDAERRPVATLTIPDDGQAVKAGRADQLQSAEATAECESAGVYRLHVSG